MMRAPLRRVIGAGPAIDRCREGGAGEEEVVHAGHVLVEVRAGGVVPAVDRIGMGAWGRTPELQGGESQRARCSNSTARTFGSFMSTWKAASTLTDRPRFTAGRASTVSSQRLTFGKPLRSWPWRSARLAQPMQAMSAIE